MVLHRLPKTAVTTALAGLLLCAAAPAQDASKPFTGARGAVVEDLSIEGGAAGADLFQVRRSKTRIPSGKDRVAIDLFEPSGMVRHPAVVVLHGTHGPRRGEAYYLAMTEDLARHGYVALFLRFYDRGRKNGSRGVRSQWSASIGHAIDYLQTLPNVDADRIGVVGYSQGAFMALNYAPKDPRIQAISALYGGLSPGFLPDAQQHMPPVLILHGTADRIVPVRRALETSQWLRDSGKPVDLVIYPTVGHGFTLHERGGWDEVAGADAWERTLDFLDFHLRYTAWRPEPPALLREATSAPTVGPPAPAPAEPTPVLKAEPLPEMAHFSLGLPGEETAENPLALPPLRTLPHLAAPRSEKGKDFVMVNPDFAEVRALAAKHAPPRKKKSGKKGSGSTAKAPAGKAAPPAKAPAAKPSGAPAPKAPPAKPAATPAGKTPAKTPAPPPVQKKPASPPEPPAK